MIRIEPLKFFLRPDPALDWPRLVGIGAVVAAQGIIGGRRVAVSDGRHKKRPSVTFVTDNPDSFGAEVGLDRAGGHVLGLDSDLFEPDVEHGVTLFLLSFLRRDIDDLRALAPHDRGEGLADMGGLADTRICGNM